MNAPSLLGARSVPRASSSPNLPSTVTFPGWKTTTKLCNAQGSRLLHTEAPWRCDDLAAKRGAVHIGPARHGGAQMAPVAAQAIDVRDMAIVHQAFRRAYAEAARLVRAESAPSPERLTFLADHVDFGIAMLHVHHRGEDELLYPKLVERAPEQAPMINDVEHEHQLVATALDATSAACAAWRKTPSRETAEALAAALDELNAVTQRHLDDEEHKIVPLAALTLTQKEWNAVGKHGFGEIPRDKRGVALGLLLEPLNEADRAYMKANLPAAVRILYPVLIDRAWKRYAAELRSGA